MKSAVPGAAIILIQRGFARCTWGHERRLRRACWHPLDHALRGRLVWSTDFSRRVCARSGGREGGFESDRSVAVLVLAVLVASCAARRNGVATRRGDRNRASAVLRRWGVSCAGPPPRKAPRLRHWSGSAPAGRPYRYEMPLRCLVCCSTASWLPPRYY